MSSFSVIMSRFGSLDPEHLVTAMCNTLPTTRFDVLRSMGPRQGVLAQGLEEKQARRVCAVLCGLGYPATCVPDSRIPVLEGPRSIRWCALSQESFSYPHGLHGETTQILWERVLVIDVGRGMKLSRQMKEVSSSPLAGLPHTTVQGAAARMAVDYLTPQYKRTGEVFDVLDLIGVDVNGAIQHLRLPSKDFSYEKVLGAGTELSRFERFTVIVDYMVQHALNAVVSPAVYDFLEAHEAIESVVENIVAEESLQQHQLGYQRWLLAGAITGFLKQV